MKFRMPIIASLTTSEKQMAKLVTRAETGFTEGVEYIVFRDEKDVIDCINTEFRREGIREIERYDIIGWALQLTRETYETKSKVKQAPELVWVNPSPRFPKGRPSRTLLELAILSRTDDRYWKTHGCTTAYGRGVPYRTRPILESHSLFEKLALQEGERKRKRAEGGLVEVDFLLPAGWIDTSYEELDSSAKEQIHRKDLVRLRLLTPEGRSTGFCKVLVDAFERWWITEQLFRHPEIIKDVVQLDEIRFPPAVAFFITAKARWKVKVQDLASWYRLEPKAILDYFTEVRKYTDI